MGVEERAETRGEVVERPGGEGPAVHRHVGVRRERRPCRAVVLGEHRGAVAQLDMRALGQRGQAAVRFDRADPAGNVAVFRQGVAQAVARHGEMQRRVMLRAGEMLGQELEARAAVIVVGVDNGERLAHDVAAAEHRVARAPRLLPALRHGVAVGQSVQLLIHVADRDVPRYGIADLRFELLLDRVLDHEHDLAEPGVDRVIYRIVDDLFAGRADGRDLLQSAEAAAHPGRHDDKRWLDLFHCRSSFPCLSMVLSVIIKPCAASRKREEGKIGAFLHISATNEH